MSQQSMDIPMEDLSDISQGTDSYSFCVLSTDEVSRRMKAEIHDANAVLQLPAKTMMLLLNYFGWDKEKLMERYYDTDQETLFNKAGVSNYPRSCKPKTSSQEERATKIRRQSEDCAICYNDFPSNKMYGMEECGHRFCRPCWRAYFTMKIMDDGIGQMMSCMGHECPIPVDEETVMKIVKDSKIKSRYQQLITDSFVNCNRSLKWCPSPNCTNAIQVEYTDCQPVTCACGFSFCFQCIHENHQPLTCDLLKKWLKKCNDDSETANWIVANTKDCPKCKTAIEKNGGCNHMTCHRCRNEFCWSCLGLWSLHVGETGYHCNSFDPEKDQTQKKTQTALKRYIFYWDRYMNHSKSLKFEDKLKVTVNAKIEEMTDQGGMTLVETDFLKAAVDVLRGCRQTLMYAYGFAFYLEKNNESVIFEDNQWDLESSTEALSGYLEQDINSKDIKELTSEEMRDFKSKVQDKYRYCEKRRQVLLKHVAEGYQNDSWVYNDEY